MNPSLGFRPAFLDTTTFAIHLSRYADGRPAPFYLLDGLPDDLVVARSMFAFYLLDGLPDDLVVARSMFGRAVAARATLVLGFERNGFFYTRSAAARATTEWIPSTGAND